MKSKIAIFPLNLVVFPYSKYPLHIFENRYKKMIQKCLDNDEGFGIIAKIGEEISSIGSYVTILKTLKKYITGEMDIIVKAQKRFHILDYIIGPDGYFIADVEEYPDFNSEIDINLVEELQTRFEHILDKINYHLEESFWKNYYSTAVKSFKVAEKSGLSLEQQQTLLSIQNENERLSFLLEYFEKVDENLSENVAQRNIILGNGYIN
jgi:Lon protease-like protein